jgi:hypothetical protein
MAWAVDSDTLGDNAWEVDEFAVYHYLSPRKMLAADYRVQVSRL